MKYLWWQFTNKHTDSSRGLL